MAGRAKFILALAILANLVLAAILPKNIAWGTEVSRIAASVARGQGFSSPFHQPTGPSAWIPPVYPYLLAAIFYFFGVFTTASFWVVVAFNIVVHALTCFLLYRAAADSFGERAGYYSACALASFPLLFYPLVLLHVLGGYRGLGLFISPNIIWYIHLSELFIVLLIWLTLHPPHWSVYGLIWGFAALLNPTILALAPGFFAWRVWQRKDWRYLCLTTLVATLCVAPWLIRNDSVFHRPVFIRDNLGVELRLGNQPGRDGLWASDIHPDRNDFEMSRVVQLGEIEYSKVCGEEAFQTIRTRPGEFLRNTMLRVSYWWVGTPMQSSRLGRLQFVKYLPQLLFSTMALWGIAHALQKKNANALLFVGVLAFYPLIYYVTHAYVGFMYQYPVHPEMLGLAASVIFRARDAENQSPRPRLWFWQSERNIDPARA